MNAAVQNALVSEVTITDIRELLAEAECAGDREEAVMARKVLSGDLSMIAYAENRIRSVRAEAANGE
jgi:hypothetical protein